jgi:hypothetical protein
MHSNVTIRYAITQKRIKREKNEDAGVVQNRMPHHKKPTAKEE